jgi:hypothetical protein
MPTNPFTYVLKGTNPLAGVVLRPVKHGATFVKGFWRDLQDKGALLKDETATDVVSVASLIFVSLGGIAGLTGNIQNILMWIAPVPIATVPLLCGIIGFLWALGLIMLKDTSNEADPLLGDAPIAVTRYRYTQPPRVLAKYAFSPLLAIALFSGFRIWHEIQPISGIIYGFIRDGVGPLPGVTMRLYSSDNRDLTKASWNSDSRGFYMIEPSASVARSAHMLAISSECPRRDALLQLRLHDEMPADSFPPDVKGLHPVFRHTIACREGK